MDDLRRAAAALQAIDSGCSREDWIRVGMAAKSAGLSFDEFHNWSASADNYRNESDCRAVWKSFGDSGPITAATLFSMATAQGWQEPAKGHNGANGRMPIIPTALPAKTSPRPTNQAAGVNPSHVLQLCEPATNLHGYIAKKRGIATGLYVHSTTAPPLTIRGQSVAGFLVVPCVSISDGRLLTFQFIPADGAKLNLAGASFGDGAHIVGNIGESNRMFICEGLGQAWACWQATGQAALVCFGAGRMRAVTTALRAKYPAAVLVLVPDRAKESQAAAIAGEFSCQWVELPQDKPGNYDANDFALEHGADVLADLLDKPKSPPKTESRYKLLSGAELCAAPPMRWTVRGVLPREGLAGIWGPSGCGKTFLAMDLACAVAGALELWFGRRVTQTPVIYVCLEGEQGFGKRIAAWMAHHQCRVPDALRFVTQPFDLLSLSDVPDLAKAIQAAGGGGLTIIDTLNRAAPGADENSSKDMGLLIAACKELQILVGGLVLVVHHTGKDAARGLRGHSSLYAALDAAIEVVKTDARHEWNIAKSKDDETGTAHAFKLKVVQVGTDDDGEAITSCVCLSDESTHPSTAVQRAKLPAGGNQKIALDALAEPLRKSTEFGKEGAPPGHPCIRLDDAIGIVADRLACEAKRRTERARSALTSLIASGIYGMQGDWLWRI